MILQKNPKSQYILIIISIVLLSLFLFFSTIYVYYLYQKPVVIKPIHDGVEVGLVIIQGEDISSKQYIPIAQAIQKASPDLKLWVGLPQFIDSAPITRETGLAVDAAIGEMKKQGMGTNNIFFAAHSEGGIASQEYLNSHPDVAKGQILMGSFLTTSYSKLNDKGKTIINYPVPTLTIGGSLDGLARITRMATAFWHQQINASDPSAPAKFPVVVIDGSSHMEFASGDPPAFVEDYDLKPIISEAEVHRQVGDLVYNFIVSRLQGSGINYKLQTSLEKTKTLLSPILTALKMEGYNGFKPACYDRQEDDTRDDPKCTPYSPWIQENANSILAAADRSPVGFDLNIIDSFHRSYTVDPFHQPHVHIPEVRNSCSGSKDCTLTISSVTQAIYSLPTVFDTGLFPVAASSLRSKLNSRQNIWSHAGVENPNYQETDGPSRCAEINQQAYNWALSNASPNARSYFEEVGEPLVVGEDKVPIVAAGPLWIWNYPSYKYIKATEAEQIPVVAPVYQVRATAMKTSIKYPIKDASGIHYCQLLSPAAAMEWIYIDGLRPQASLANFLGDAKDTGLFSYGPFDNLDEVARVLLRQMFRQTRTKTVYRAVGQGIKQLTTSRAVPKANADLK